MPTTFDKPGANVRGTERRKAVAGFDIGADCSDKPQYRDVLRDKEWSDENRLKRRERTHGNKP